MSTQDQPKPETTPTTVADCQADYAAANTPERQAAARDQLARARTNGNASGGFWRGRRR